MAGIKEVLRYFVKNYPYNDELSKTRITKMVYLADWFSAKKRKKQITPIVWYFDHYGPYVPDVFEATENDNQLKIDTTYTPFGSEKKVIKLKSSDIDCTKNLSDDEIEILDAVIKETRELDWNDFIDYVYGTFPIKNSQRYSELDLVKFAEQEDKAN